ncbi:MAG TPA: hypothetical protein PKI28_06585 [Accumulibacter sp.]|nr:hypothetical protein [Accumulibacter sp.]HNL12998.1 hypothetical protein [Accumulibacter sp.]HNO57322.1 hypothetical protein [Accumulibacter sp.]
MSQRIHDLNLELLLRTRRRDQEVTRRNGTRGKSTRLMRITKQQISARRLQRGNFSHEFKTIDGLQIKIADHNVK